MTIEQLQKQEKELNILISENRSKQRELNKKTFIKKHGIDIGDTIEWMDGKTLRRGVVSEIEFSGVNANYYKALLFNSDGKIGKRDMRIWTYQSDYLKLISKGVIATR